MKSAAAFVRLFDRDRMPTFLQWMKKAQVQSGQIQTSLETYQQGRHISTDHLKKLYDHIVHRNEYLTRFNDLITIQYYDIHTDATVFDFKRRQKEDAI